MTMITNLTEQFERAGPAHLQPVARRRILRRRHVAAPVATAPADMRTAVATAFRSLARGVHPQPAQAQAAAFYRSSGQAWARSLGETGEPVSRARVANAFRAMAHGVGPRAAHAPMLRFFRSSGHDWTRGLTEAA